MPKKTKTKRRSATGKRAHGRDKVAVVMHEFKHHTLHSGSKRGPLVRSRRQAIAIALSEQRRSDKGRRKCKHCGK